MILYMSKKEFIIIALKVIIYAAGLFLAALGVSATLTSCTVSHSLDARGRAVIVTTDTTVINHTGILDFPKR